MTFIGLITVPRGTTLLSYLKRLHIDVPSVLRMFPFLWKAFTVSTEKEMFGHIKLLREASRLADAYAVLNQSRYEFGQVTEHLCTNHFGLHHRDMSKARVPLYRNTHCRPLVTSD